MSKYSDTERLNYLEENFRDFKRIDHPTMDGRYPCWSFWSRAGGRQEKKDLRDALDICLRESKN